MYPKIQMYNKKKWMALTINTFKPISLTQVPASCARRKNQEGMIRMFVTTALMTLFFVLPADHYMFVMFLKAALMPKTPPIHANKMEV